MYNLNYWFNLLDDRYEVVPKKEYKKEILENEIKTLKRNVEQLTSLLSTESEKLKQKEVELKSLS